MERFQEVMKAVFAIRCTGFGRMIDDVVGDEGVYGGGVVLFNGGFVKLVDDGFVFC